MLTFQQFQQSKWVLPIDIEAQARQRIYKFSEIKQLQEDLKRERERGQEGTCASVALQLNNRFQEFYYELSYTYYKAFPNKVVFEDLPSSLSPDELNKIHEKDLK